jgi:hypothetical protein
MPKFTIFDRQGFMFGKQCWMRHPRRHTVFSEITQHAAPRRGNYLEKILPYDL